MLVVWPTAAESGASRRPPARTALSLRFCTGCLLSKRHGKNDRAGLAVSDETVDILVLFPYVEITGNAVAQRTGSANLPLHGGRVPGWLAARMTRLSAVMSQAIVHHYGRD